VDTFQQDTGRLIVMALRRLHKAFLQNQTIPETTKQPDVLDEPAASHIPRYLVVHHRRRVRQVSRV
jgi:hypothetical protein